MAPGDGTSHVLEGCRRPAPGDAYPVALMRQRYEARILLAVDLNVRGRMENVRVLASEGRPEFQVAARKLMLGFRCKKPDAPRELRISFTYSMIDGPGVSHYLERDDQLTITGESPKRR
jgi:TonB family protein